MPVTFIDGSEDSYTALTGALPTKRLMDYIRDKSNDFRGALSQSGQYIQDKLTTFYRAYDHSHYERLRERMDRELRALDLPNIIQRLRGLDQLRAAPDVMLTPIMAMPALRKRYHNQQLDGYAGRYVDDQPGEIGHDHVEYQRITHGIWMKGEDTQWSNTVYSNIQADDNAYGLDESLDILNTWEEIQRELDKGFFDPTSIERASL